MKKFIKDLTDSLRETCEKMIEINRLVSEDIRVFIRSAEIKNDLQKDAEWITIIAFSAALRKRIYDVIMHDVRVKSVNTINQMHIIEKLMQHNDRLHKKLMITKISWSNRAMQDNKLFSFLRMKIAIVIMINRLIVEEFLVEHEIKYCERYVQNSRMTQCFNCYKYEHIDKFCRYKIKCDYCANSYDSQDCNVTVTTTSCKCVTCDYDHEA